jgi:predicted NBD/HSP70 family sugar kinase
MGVRNRFEQALFFALVGMTTAYEPEVIVLGGGVAESLGEILPGIEQRLRALIPECPALAISKLGDPAGAVGALIVGLQDAYVQMGVNPSELDVSVGPRLVELLQSSEPGTEHVA